MENYRHIVPDIYAKASVRGKPIGLPSGVSFRRGVVISEQFGLPMVYEAPYTSDDQLQHFESELVPLMSGKLVRALQAAGVSNLQLFPAVVTNPATQVRWDDYYSVNIIGLIACAAASSDMNVVGIRADGHTPLAVFNGLIIDPGKAGGALMFRLAESPGTILLAESVLSRLMDDSPPAGWNFTAYPVPSA